MSGTIVDIEEYRKKNSRKMMADALSVAPDSQVDVQIELRIPLLDSHYAEEAYQRHIDHTVSKYKSDLHGELVRREKVIMGAVRYMELRMTLKIILMCLISIIISTAVISLFL